MNIVCIIQARTGSTRLPNKIFLELKGKPVLARDIERLKGSKLISKIVIASPDKKEDDVIEKFVNNNFPDVGVFRGSEDDVLDRYFQAAKKFGAEAVIRITSDCPLIDPEVVDKVISKFVESKADYVSNVLGKRTFPRGMDTEIFSFAALERIWNECADPADREHVTLHLRKHPEQYTAVNCEGEKDYSGYRLTLDEPKDFELISAIYDSLGDNPKLDEIIGFLEKNPDLAKINQEVEQKHGKF